MKVFLFLTRVGFILNLIFIICIVLRYIPSLQLSQPVVGFFLIAGLVLSFVVNIILQIMLLVLMMGGNRKFPLSKFVVANLVIAVFQICYFFFTS